MGISGAVEWWEEWQLRILVLGSLFVQWLLFLSSALRKLAIPSWFRSVIWLAYLGSDTLAIYALAILFGRQRRQDCDSGQSNSILEVVWAPVLLTHLGGQDLITAYNIEDNELWTRHVLTAMSQVTVAIYVFCKSWPGSDKRLLQAAILFFVPGILKCIEKPWALKSASINSLVNSSCPAPRRTTDREGEINSLQDYVQKARAFVQSNPRHQAQESDAVDLEAANHLSQSQGEDNVVDFEAGHQPLAQGEAAAVDLEHDHHPQTSSTWRGRLNKLKETLISLENQQKEKRASRLDKYNVDLEAYKLFLDLASPYPDRLGILKSFWVLDEKRAYALLQNRLFGAFDLLYTKRKMLSLWEAGSISGQFSGCIRLLVCFLPWAAIGLFDKSHKEAYDVNDVKVTYVLFCCTALLEFSSVSLIIDVIASSSYGGFSLGPIVAGLYEQAKRKAMRWLWVVKVRALYAQLDTLFQWQWLKAVSVINTDTPILSSIIDQLRCALSKDVLKHSFIGQYALVGFFARNKRHTGKMCILNFFNCKDFVDQHWSMKSCNSSFAIIGLVLKYVKKGWGDQMKNADSYGKFNDRRGQWALQANKCDQALSFILMKPFDECVLLWHIATDFCFYFLGASADHLCVTAQCEQDYASGQSHGCVVWCEKSPHHERAVRCREISNYMMYLLFVNPEMLLAGTRRNLFVTANAEVEEILKDDKALLKILKARKPWLKEMLRSENLTISTILDGGVCREIHKAEKKWLKEIEREVVHRIIAKVLQATEQRAALGYTESPTDAEIYPSMQEGFIHDSWKLANLLLDIGDEKTMWGVIEGVWVEMLCFSASRCRGYLHAKSLGTGGELLTYVWLLLSHMGMETLPERLQRPEVSSGEGNPAAALSNSQVRKPMLLFAYP